MEPYEIDLTLAAARRTSEDNAAFTPRRTRLGIPRLTGVAAAVVFSGGAIVLLVLGLRAILLAMKDGIFGAF